MGNTCLDRGTSAGLCSAYFACGEDESPSRNSKMSSKVEAKIKLILEFCPEPKSFIEIMEHIGLKDRVSFKRLYIQRMLDEGLLKMTNPDNPTSRNQLYVTQK